MSSQSTPRTWGRSPWSRLKALALNGAFSIAARLYAEVKEKRRMAEEAVAAGKAKPDTQGAWTCLMVVGKPALVRSRCAAGPSP